MPDDQKEGRCEAHGTLWAQSRHRAGSGSSAGSQAPAVAGLVSKALERQQPGLPDLALLRGTHVNRHCPFSR